MAHSMPVLVIHCHINQPKMKWPKQQFIFELSHDIVVHWAPPGGSHLGLMGFQSDDLFASSHLKV